MKLNRVLLVLALITSAVFIIQSPVLPLAQECSARVETGQSIQTAIDSAEQGAVICLSKGTFNENIVIIKSLSLIGEGNQQTVLQGKIPRKPIINIETDEKDSIKIYNFIIAQSLTVISSGIEARGPGDILLSRLLIKNHMMGGVILLGARNISLVESTLTNMESQPLIVVLSRLELTASQITYNLAEIAILAATSEMIITDSQITNNGQSLTGATASTISLNNTWVLLENSSVTRNMTNAIYLTDSSNLYVRDSKISDNRLCGLYQDDQRSQISLEGSELHNNGHAVCGFAPASLRAPLLVETTATELSVPGDYATLQEAIDAIAPGGTIHLAKGNHLLPALVWKPLSLKGAGRDETKLIARPGHGLSILAGADEVRLSQLTLSGGIAGVLAYSHVAADDVLILGGGESEFSTGIFMGGNARLQLASSAVRGYGTGLGLFGQSASSVADSQISSNSATGITIADATAPVLIDHSEINNNKYAGIELFRAPMTLTNSDVSSNGHSGIEIGPGAKAEVIGSKINSNGLTEPLCGVGSQRCNGLYLWGQSTLLLKDSVVSDNWDWAIGVEREPCAAINFSPFEGSVSFEGTNTITGNNKSEKLSALGNPGSHPFTDLPAGQVCIP